MIREEFSEEMSFKERAEGSEGGSLVDVWGRVIQAEGAVSLKPQDGACFSAPEEQQGGHHGWEEVRKEGRGNV